MFKQNNVILILYKFRMNYKVEISGGLLGIKTILEGQLTTKDSLIQKALLTEKILLNLNPNNGLGCKYTFTIEKGRKNMQEYFFDETTLKGSFKELLTVAEVEAEIYQ